MSPTTELTWRFGCFATILVVMAVWEMISPFRQMLVGRGSRWVCNLGLLGLNTAVVRLMVPLSAIAAAERAQLWGCGLLARWPGPAMVTGIVAVLLLDLAIYLQHRVFHAVPVLWRIHQVHHADLDLDVTTGVRFHLIEIALSALFKVLLVLGLGPSPEAVLAFEVLLNGSAMFNHANVELPGWMERPLRWCLVTPGMHRIHHSAQPADWSTNFGFQVSWWDRLLNTYRDEPCGGTSALRIGLPNRRDPDEVDRFTGALALPFRTSPPKPADRSPHP